MKELKWLFPDKLLSQKQADEFAIGFAEWCLADLLNGLDPKGDTMQELLEIYKKQLYEKLIEELPPNGIDLDIEPINK